MYGAARPAFPLLAEAGTPLPGGTKPNGKISRPSAGYLWEHYQALPAGQKAIVRLKALMDPPVNRTNFQEAARKAGLQLGGKPFSWSSLNGELQMLQRKGLLTADFACAPEILHMAAVDACASADAADLAGAAKAVMPKSNRDRSGSATYHYCNPTPLPQDIDLFRHLRLAVYAGDEAEFLRLCNLAEAEEIGGVPVEPGLVRAIARCNPGNVRRTHDPHVRRVWRRAYRRDAGYLPALCGCRAQRSGSGVQQAAAAL
ncbi:MAG: hypothetical protein ACLQKK_17515 [Rhodomicrobium sp.]